MPYCSSCGRLVTGEGRFCAACGAPQAGAPSPGGHAPPPAAPERRPFPGWAVALLVVLALSVASLFAVFIVPVLLMGSIFSAVEKTLPADVHAAEVRTGVRNIRMGIETWRVDNARGTYPPEAVVTPARLGQYVEPWPANPYTGGLMQPGGGPGGYVYVRPPGGGGFTLTGYGDDGDPVLTVP
jgi:hypothetical protein